MYSMKEACKLTDMTYENLKFYCKMTWNLPQYLRMRWYCSILREASVINSDNKLITLAHIGRIIWT